MTNLSWFLYLADVFQNVGAFFGVFGMALIVVAIICAALKAHKNDMEDTKGGYKIYAVIAAFGLASIFITIPIPSKQTMYTIAAVEVGNVVVNSPEGREVLEEVRKRILSELEIEGDK